MAIKINVGGRKPAATAKTAAAKKPAARKAPAKATATKTAAKKPAAARKPAASSNGNGRADERTVAAFTKKLAAAGKKRDSMEKAHVDAVDEMFEIALEALNAGVRMSVVSEVTGVSRQWLYKGLEARAAGPKKKPGRPPANGKAAAKPAAKKTTASKTTTKRATATKPAAKAAGKRPRIAIKAR